MQLEIIEKKTLLLLVFILECTTGATIMTGYQFVQENKGEIYDLTHPKSNNNESSAGKRAHSEVSSEDSDTTTEDSDTTTQPN